MAKFEHAVLTIGVDGSNIISERMYFGREGGVERFVSYPGEDATQKFDSLFTELGSDGFELVSVVSENEHRQTFYFKRQVS
ncbi:MAG TPA: hypothetical protein VFQ54_11545 [Thermomicrobiales bacterium]|nr:hypothetical protein [Thermomicrobiales bacterium]